MYVPKEAHYVSGEGEGELYFPSDWIWLSLTAAKLSTAVDSSGGSYVGIFET